MVAEIILLKQNYWIYHSEMYFLLKELMEFDTLLQNFPILPKKPHLLL